MKPNFPEKEFIYKLNPTDHEEIGDVVDYIIKNKIDITLVSENHEIETHKEAELKLLSQLASKNYLRSLGLELPREEQSEFDLYSKGLISFDELLKKVGRLTSWAHGLKSFKPFFTAAKKDEIDINAFSKKDPWYYYVPPMLLFHDFYRFSLTKLMAEKIAEYATPSLNFVGNGHLKKMKFLIFLQLNNDTIVEYLPKGLSTYMVELK